ANALAIANRRVPGYQAVSEQSLHLCGALVTERLREAYDRGRLHAGALREDCQRLERQGVRLIEHVARYLLQTLTQGVVASNDLLAQCLRRLRRRISCGHRNPS